MLLPGQLSEFIARSRLTQWFSVPSTFTYMARLAAVPEEGFPTLKRVIWCGEVLPTPVVAHWMRRVPQARFTNLYGPTEATIASSFYTVPAVPTDETQPIPIGTACDGEELLVLDDRLRPVPVGEVGEPLDRRGRPESRVLARRRPDGSGVPARSPAGPPAGAHLQHGRSRTGWRRRARAIPRPARLPDQESGLSDRAGRDRGGTRDRLRD